MKPSGMQNTDAPLLRLEGFLPYRIARAAENVSRRFARLYRDKYGMTRPEWRTLATIGQFGMLTATDIAAHSSMHKTKVSRAVVALQNRGWLSRTPDKTDRRVEHLSLTRAGRTAYRDLARIAAGFEERLIAMIGTEAAGNLSAGLDALERLDGDRVDAGDSSPD